MAATSATSSPAAMITPLRLLPSVLAMAPAP